MQAKSRRRGERGDARASNKDTSESEEGDGHDVGGDQEEEEGDDQEVQEGDDEDGQGVQDRDEEDDQGHQEGDGDAQFEDIFDG